VILIEFDFSNFVDVSCRSRVFYQLDWFSNIDHRIFSMSRSVTSPSVSALPQMIHMG
jgi:hypothetical protein